MGVKFMEDRYGCWADPQHGGKVYFGRSQRVQDKEIMANMLYDYMCLGIPTSKRNKDSKDVQLNTKYADWLNGIDSGIMLKTIGASTSRKNPSGQGKGKYCSMYAGQLTLNDCRKYIDDLEKADHGLAFSEYADNIVNHRYSGTNAYTVKVDRPISHKKNPNEDLRPLYNKDRLQSRVGKRNTGKKSEKTRYEDGVFIDDDHQNYRRDTAFIDFGAQTDGVWQIIIVVYVILLIWGYFTLQYTGLVQMQIIAGVQLVLAKALNKATICVAFAGFFYELAYVFQMVHKEISENASMKAFWLCVIFQILIYVLDGLKK